MMRTQSVLDVDRSRQWFLDRPESQVLSASSERELLLELAECRQELFGITRRPDGSEWKGARPDAAFRQLIRDLADGGGGDGPHVEEARRLARRYVEIRTALAMANARLVAYIARRYYHRGTLPSDLLQEGFCGLLEAIDRFDPVNTTRLATYASWWIRQAIQRAIADGSYPVRLTPRQLRRLARSLPRTTTDTEAPGESPAAWHELAAIRPRISLDAASRYDDSTPLANLLAAMPDTDPEGNERSESVEALLETLGPREQLVIRLRFGLDGHPHHSLSQIGAVLSVSKERVRQIQDRALRRLQNAAGSGPVGANSSNLEG